MQLSALESKRYASMLLLHGIRTENIGGGQKRDNQKCTSHEQLLHVGHENKDGDECLAHDKEKFFRIRSGSIEIIC